MAKVEGATRTDAFAMAPEVLLLIGRDVAPGMKVPHVHGEHHLFERRALEEPDRATVDGMKRFGVIQPITVERYADTDLYAVAAGRRRVINARQANIELIAAGEPPIQVKCIIRKANVLSSTFVKVIENHHRRDVDVWTMVENAVDMHDRDISDDDIAMAFGRTGKGAAKWVASLRSIADVHPDTRAAIQAGTLSLTAAIEVASLPRDTQPAVVASIVSGVRSVAPDPSAPTNTATGGTPVPMPATSGRGNGSVKRAKEAARAAKEAAAAAEGKKRHGNAKEPSKYPIPSKSELRKIIDLPSEKRIELGIDPSTIAALRFVLGLGPADKVAGLKGALKEIGGASSWGEAANGD